MEPTKNRASGTTPPDNGVTGAKHIAQDAKQLATDVVDRAKDLAGERVSDTQQKSAGQIGQVAKVLRGASEDLGDSFAAPLMERAARALDQVSGSVGGASLPDTIRATERFARREPLLFLGGAFAVGLLAARFLRSTSRRNQASGGDDGYDYDDDEELYEQGGYQLGSYESPYGRSRDSRSMSGSRMDLDRRNTMPMGAMSGGGGMSSGMSGSTGGMPGGTGTSSGTSGSSMSGSVGSVPPPIPSSPAAPTTSTTPNGIGGSGTENPYPPPVPGGPRRS